MDDLLALDGGSSATQWQKRHARRKAAEARKKLRAIVRAERNADFKKRMKRWRTKWQAEAAQRKTLGLPPPSKKGKPRDIPKSNLIDMTGMRFGRLSVVRIAPTSRQGSQRCRVWWVKCDCGSPERMVNGTTLRQGRSQSCGCLHRERLRAQRGVKRGKPLSVRMRVMAEKVRSRGEIKMARLLELGSRANVREERARQKGRLVIRLRGPRKPGGNPLG